MPKRSSIAMLMGLIGVVAVGLVSLNRPSEFWASVWLTATLAALGVALIHAAFGSARSRPFWAGFGVLGGLYLACVYGPLSRTDRHAPAPLLTDYGIVRLQERMRPEVLESATLSGSITGSGSLSTPRSVATTSSFPSIRNPFVLGAHSLPDASFEQVGQCLCTLLVGFAGGTYAAWVAGRRRRDEANDAAGVSPSSP